MFNFSIYEKSKNFVGSLAINILKLL